MEEPSVPSTVFWKNKTFLIVAGVVLVVVYFFLNISIWMYAKGAKKAAQTEVETEIAVPPSPIPPTPTPRPTGPGPYACSIIGMCKLYDDTVRKENCTVTYADPLCLDQCADPTKQCKN